MEHSNLFSDFSEEVNKLIYESFNYSKANDPNYNKRDYEMLCNLKLLYPEFKIEIGNFENSHFSPSPIGIYLNKSDCNYYTFFHELTHAYHWIQSNFSTPPEFRAFQVKMKSNRQNLKQAVLLVNFLHNQKVKIMVNKLLNKNGVEHVQFSDSFMLQLSIINAVEDIIDALYNGISFESGLSYIKDKNSIKETSAKSAGHGCEYFKNKDYIFAEILADFAMILKSNYKDEILELLELGFGNEILSILADAYQALGNSILNFNNTKTTINNSNKFK